jgi:hypothetical protein
VKSRAHEHVQRCEERTRGPARSKESGDKPALLLGQGSGRSTASEEGLGGSRRLRISSQCRFMCPGLSTSMVSGSYVSVSCKEGLFSFSCHWQSCFWPFASTSNLQNLKEEVGVLSHDAVVYVTALRSRHPIPSILDRISGP